jgi:hypothetical protein
MGFKLIFLGAVPVFVVGSPQQTYEIYDFMFTIGYVWGCVTIMNPKFRLNFAHHLTNLTNLKIATT